MAPTHSQNHERKWKKEGLPTVDFEVHAGLCRRFWCSRRNGALFPDLFSRCWKLYLQNRHTLLRRRHMIVLEQRNCLGNNMANLLHTSFPGDNLEICWTKTCTCKIVKEMGNFSNLKISAFFFWKKFLSKFCGMEYWSPRWATCARNTKLCFYSDTIYIYLYCLYSNICLIYTLISAFTAYTLLLHIRKHVAEWQATILGTSGSTTVRTQMIW